MQLQNQSPAYVVYSMALYAVVKSDGDDFSKIGKKKNGIIPILKACKQQHQAANVHQGIKLSVQL
jgi:hypothetical protein